MAARASEVAAAVETDRDVLISAAWLHDIGYAPRLVDTGFHPLDGARFLEVLGLPRRIVSLVAHHTNALAEARERGLAEAWTAEFDLEKSPTADLLWYCDMTTGPDGEALTVPERIAEIQHRYGPDAVVTRFIERATPDLMDMADRAAKLAASVSPGKARRHD